MKKIVLLIFGILIASSSVLLAYAKDIGQYTCKYYMRGKDNNCIIKITTSGTTSPNCSFLSQETMNRLITSKKCTYKPHVSNTLETYTCKYPTGICKVTNKGDSTYTAKCDKGLDGNKAIRDSKTGMCLSDKPKKMKYICEYADVSCIVTPPTNNTEYNVSCSSDKPLMRHIEERVINDAQEGLCRKSFE